MMTLEQYEPRQVFELFQRLRDGRLGHVELARGLGDPALICHDAEIQQLLQSESKHIKSFLFTG